MSWLLILVLAGMLVVDVVIARLLTPIRTRCRRTEEQDRAAMLRAIQRVTK